MAEIEGVVNVWVLWLAKLVCTAVPPVRAVYHRNVPPPGAVLVADRVTVPVPQRLPCVTEGAVHCACTKCTEATIPIQMASAIKFLMRNSWVDDFKT